MTAQRVHSVLPEGDGAIEWGTVGWDGTGDDYFDLGDGSDGQNGITLVQVTLHRGRAPTSELDDARAQGDRILCQLADVFLCIPPRNTRVFVAIPDTFGSLPGASTILQVVDRRGQQIFGNDYTPGDTVLPALTSMARVSLKGDGSITVTNDKATIAIDGSGNISVSVTGSGTITLAGGGAAVAREGDSVKIPGLSVVAPAGTAGGPCTISYGATTVLPATPGPQDVIGSVTSGSSIVSSG